MKCRIHKIIAFALSSIFLCSAGCCNSALEKTSNRLSKPQNANHKYSSWSDVQKMKIISIPNNAGFVMKKDGKFRVYYKRRLEAVNEIFVFEFDNSKYQHKTYLKRKDFADSRPYPTRFIITFDQSAKAYNTLEQAQSALKSGKIKLIYNQQKDPSYFKNITSIDIK